MLILVLFLIEQIDYHKCSHSYFGMLTSGFCYTTPRIRDLNGWVYCARLSNPFLRMLRGLESTSKSFLMPYIAIELP